MADKKSIAFLYTTAVFIAFIALASLLDFSGQNRYAVGCFMIGGFFLFDMWDIWSRKKISSDIEVLFMRGNLDEIIDYQKNTIKRVPQAKLIRYYFNSIAFSLFGKFDEAKTEAEKMNTVGLAPFYEGLCQHAKALNFYLQGNFKTGFLCAKNAKYLSGMSKSVPGKKTAEYAQEAYLEIASILLGEQNQNTIEQLEERFDYYFFLLKLVVAWALARHYRTIDQEKFQYYDEFLERSAPSCWPLRKYSE